MSEPIGWEREGEQHFAHLNGWAARIWDFGSHRDHPPYPNGRPFWWGVRPALSMEEHDREDFEATLDEAKAAAEQSLGELAVEAAPEDGELGVLLRQLGRRRRQ